MSTVEVRQRPYVPMLTMSRPMVGLCAVGVNVVLAAAIVMGVGPLVLVATAAVPLAWGLHLRPQKGVLVLLALAPFDGLLALVPGGESLDGWKQALTIIVFVAALVAPASSRREPDTGLPPWTVPVAAFFGIGLVSALAVGGLQGITALRITYVYILVAITVWLCPLDERERDHVVTILMATAVVTALYGLFQQVVGHAALAGWGYEYNDTIRFAGNFFRSFSSFVQPFGFGYWLTACVLIGVPVALSDHRRLRNRLFLLALPVIMLASATSFVRGAWLGLLAGLIYLGARRFQIFLLLLPIAFLAALFVPADVTQSALSTSSSQERVDRWSSAFDEVLSSPVGNGLGASGAAAEKVSELTDLSGSTYQPDNYYFKILYELGPVGLWLFLHVFIGAMLLMGRVSKDRSGPDSAFALGASASVVGAAAAAISATYLEIFPMDLLFWLLLGVIAPLARRRPDEPVLEAP